jgi:hypothetical protein
MKNYDEVGNFQNGLAKVIKDGKFGYINRKGKEVIPLIYDISQVEKYKKKIFIESIDSN